MNNKTTKIFTNRIMLSTCYTDIVNYGNYNKNINFILDESKNLR